MVLQYLRKKTKVILIGTLILIIPAFVIFYGWRASRPESIPYVVAKVGRKPITREEYLAKMENLHQIYRQLLGNSLSTEVEEQIKRQALEQLIEKHLLLQEAKIRKINVPEEEVTTRFRQYPLFCREDGKFDSGILARISKLYPRYVEALEEDIRVELTVEKLRQYITHSVEVFDDEAYEYFRSSRAKVKVKYAYLSPKTIDQRIELSDTELFRYYEDNKNALMTKSKVKIEYVVVPEKTAQAEEISEEKAFQISLKLLENDDWKSFAEQKNLTYGTTGFISEGDSIPELKNGSASIVRTAFSLSTNDVSEPIRVENLGYVIVRVVDKEPPSIPPFEQIVDKVKENLMEEKQLEIAKEKMKAVYAKLEGKRTIEEVAEEFGLEVKETDYFSQDGFIEGIGYLPNITKEAFRLSKGEYSQPITTNDGIYIIQPIEIKEPTKEEFKKSKESIKAELLHQKKEKVFREWLDGIREKNKDRITILWSELHGAH